MKKTKMQNTNERLASFLSTGPTIAELQKNPIPEDFCLFTGDMPYRMVNDALFHIVMEANPEVLKSLVCALLGLSLEDISSIEVLNPFELGNTVYDKDYILDLKIELNTHALINIEVQVLKLSFWKERSLGYLCRTFDSLNKGDDYRKTKPAIHIGILDFEVFEGDTEFFATYHLANDINHKIYSDKFRLSVLQLNQTEYATKEDISCKRVLWAKFFKATTWEEVSMLAEQDTIFAEAAKTICRVTADDRIRYHCDAIEFGIRTRLTLENQVNEQKQELEDTKLELDETKQALGETKQALGETKQALGETKQELGETKQELGETKQELQKFRLKRKDKIQRKIAKGKSLEQIAEELEEDIEDIRPLYDELLASK